MSSIFFRITPYDFLEAAPLDPAKYNFAVRIVSFKNGMENYTILNSINFNELTLLVTILRGQLIEGVNYVNDLRRIIYY